MYNVQLELETAGKSTFDTYAHNFFLIQTTKLYSITGMLDLFDL